MAAFTAGQNIGSRLPVTDDPDAPTESWRPIGLPIVSIPKRWRSSPAPESTFAREMDADGLVSEDGRRWYHLSGLGMSGLLYRVTFPDGGTPAESSLRIPAQYNHYALLGAAASQTLYIVDFSSAMTIHVVDGKKFAIERSVAAWDTGGTKGGPCAASLAPDGLRLYVIGINGSNGGGIDVIDLESLTLSAHFMGERPVTCMATSPDGRYLYATNLIGPRGRTLTTVDAQTGEERRSVDVAIEEPLFPLFATAPD